jgi:cytochrome c oxidase subunit 2
LLRQEDAVSVAAVSANAFTRVAFGPFDPHSPQAFAIASLFTNSLALCGAIFLLVSALVTACVVRFRAKPGQEPRQVDGNKLLETAWTVVPIVVLIGLCAYTARAMNVSDASIDRPPDVTVVAHQWWWEVTYPSGAVTANEVHIPTGKPLVLRLESADVVHDFWVPQLGRKMDATPGRPTAIWIEADQPGVYDGACAEFCGAEHAWMRIRVVAHPPEDFARWQEHELAPATVPKEAAAERGAGSFRTMTCGKCHAIGPGGEGPRFAPDLTHLAERSTLGAGVLPNTPADLTRWLREPQAIKPGCHMPDTGLTEAQVGDLVAYFETLQ